ncbi:MAG: photosystem II repair protein Psb32 [Nostoc sp. ChiSLP01]|nr:TPM domain-containing protein [Nostoc sp. CmiSLP01]MDZ8288581.1 TPM domain-containing protein [Nostoc sp. ChiSLP01]
MKQIVKQLFSNKKHFVRLILPLVTVILAAMLFATPALATGVYQIPGLTSGNDTWVLDRGEVISRLNEGKISSAFEDLAKETGNEVRIVTIRHFDYGETAQSFTKELFEKWFPTKEAQANQTLLVLDTVTNDTAIVTGDRIKSLLTDSIAESVANETLSTPLRRGNKYNQAFIDASDRLVAVLSGKPDPGPPQITDEVQVEGTFKNAEETKAVQGSATAWVIGLLIAATVIPMATYYIYQINQPSSDS